LRRVQNLKHCLDKRHALQCYKNFKHDIKLILYWLIFLTFSQDAH